MIKLIVINVLITVLFASVYIIVILGVVLIIKNTEILSIQYAVSMTVVDTINRLLIFFFNIGLIIINLEALVLLCRKIATEEIDFNYEESTKVLSEKRVKKKNASVWTILIFLLWFSLFFSMMIF